jgi:hypothetical protein
VKAKQPWPALEQNMTDAKQRAPGGPFLKENGKWTFYFYPHGVEQEAGEYADQDHAEQESIKMLRIWEANGFSYGPLGIVN